MSIEIGLALAGGGILAGILAGFLGIGGGTVLVPLMLLFGIPPLQAVATSNLSIVLTSISGSIQNWRMGLLNPKRVILLGFPALATAQVGVWIANSIPDVALLTAFGIMLLANIGLVSLRKHATQKASQQEQSGADPLPAPQLVNPTLARLATGGAAGLLAGVFGIGGGVIMVPLQILLLGETIKSAIQTSLGVIVITATSALVGHALKGNVLLFQGLILGVGGLAGVQISTRVLPKLPDETVSLLFRSFLGILSVYIFWQAYQSAQG